MKIVEINNNRIITGWSEGEFDEIPEGSVQVPDDFDLEGLDYTSLKPYETYGLSETNELVVVQLPAPINPLSILEI